MISNSRKVRSSIMSSIFELLSRSWEVHFAFIRREGNAMADAMSRLVHPPLEYRHWLETPLAVRDLVLTDVNLKTPLNSAVSTCLQFLIQRAYDDPGNVRFMRF
ncbi:hypothetical protein V6N11_062402 [Hibiscus sabdariffa]|uniref:RNase H type-1 domain-containing protein n=1 Tax=Hibiscus sabdariffa TaxID=183260 RepID=A0ABR2PSH7_9ROSI